MHINHTRNAMYPSMKNCTYMVYAMYLQYARSRVRMNRPINCAIKQNAQGRTRALRWGVAECRPAEECRGQSCTGPHFG